MEAIFSFVSLVSFGLFLSFLLLVISLHILRGKEKSGPPLYRGWLPWIGCAVEFGKSPLEFIEQKRKELGPIFTLCVAGERMTFLTEPEDFKHFFLSNNVSFQQGVQDAVKGVSSISQENFFKYHTSLHDTVKGRLASSRLGMISQDLCREFNEQLNSLNNDGEGELNLLIRHTMYAAIMNSLFGKDMLPVRDKAVFQKLVDAFVCYDDQFEYGARLPHFLLKDWTSSKTLLLSLFTDIVAQIDRQGEKRDDDKTLLETLISNVDRSCAPNYGLMMLWASLANAIPITFWALSFILNDEAVKKKLTAELEKHMTNREGDMVWVGEEDLKKVPYLRWCVMEAIRLRPAGIITRRVVTPFTVKGYHIPKGDMMMVSPYWSHRNTKYFPDPEVFKPERWDGVEIEKGNFLEGFIAFGGGRYMCPGRWFAMMELQMFVALFMIKFNGVLLGGVPKISTKHLVGSQQPAASCRVKYRKCGLKL